MLMNQLKEITKKVKHGLLFMNSDASSIHERIE